jgi:prepilin-type N-terminal cleavage/methylation domain-containing protein
MKRSFTLIEIIVAILIVSLISGGALLVINKFNSRQRLEKAKEEIISTIKLVQSSAKGRELPLGWADPNSKELLYIQFTKFTDGAGIPTIKAQANYWGGVWYYRKPIKDLGTNVTILNSKISVGDSSIYFAAGTGRLIGDTLGTPYSDTDTAVVIIENEAEKKEGYRIIINSLGQIKETIYYEE